MPYTLQLIAMVPPPALFALVTAVPDSAGADPVLQRVVQRLLDVVVHPFTESDACQPLKQHLAVLRWWLLQTKAGQDKDSPLRLHDDDFQLLTEMGVSMELSPRQMDAIFAKLAVMKEGSDGFFRSQPALKRALLQCSLIDLLVKDGSIRGEAVKIGSTLLDFLVSSDAQDIADAGRGSAASQWLLDDVLQCMRAWTTSRDSSSAPLRFRVDFAESRTATPEAGVASATMLRSATAWRHGVRVVFDADAAGDGAGCTTTAAERAFRRVSPSGIVFLASRALSTWRPLTTRPSTTLSWRRWLVRSTGS
jgi:hypothetical protein